MKVGEIMSGDFPALDCDATVADVESALENSKCSFAAILKPDQRPFGYVSQVDVLRCKQDPSNNPKAVHAWEICNTRPEIAHFRDEVSEVVGRLLTTHVRCVVVVDDTGTIVGLVHHEDLLKGMLQQETDPAAITPERPSPAPTLAAGNEQN